MIEITMPYIGGVLSVNSYRITSRSGSTYKIKNSVQGWMADLIDRSCKYRGMFTGIVVVEVDGKFRNKLEQPDMDNLGKVICDSLKIGLKLDDKNFRFRPGAVQFGYDKPELIIKLKGG